jgi:hypothetical protein
MDVRYRPACFRPSQLSDFTDQVLKFNDVILSSEGLLALLLRRVLGHARLVGAQSERVIVVLDTTIDDPSRARLQGFLIEVLSLPITVVPLEAVLARFLERGGGVPDGGLLAVLDDRVLVGRISKAGAKVAKIKDHTGIAAIRSELGAGGTWTEVVLWREFLKWYAEAADSALGVMPFNPSIADARLSGTSIPFSLAAVAVRRSLVPAVAGALAALDDSPDATLLVVGEDAFKLGLLRHFKTDACRGLQVRQIRLVQIARWITTAGSIFASEDPAPYGLGVLLPTSQGRPAFFRSLVPSDATRPAQATQIVVGERDAARRFRIELACSDATRRVEPLRMLFFAPGKVTGHEAEDLEVRVRVAANGKVRVDAVHRQSGSPLVLVDSRIVNGQGVEVTGPERLAELPLSIST